MGLLFSTENRCPDPAPMAELSTSKGVRLEVCADGGAEDVACRPAFAKGSRQSHIGHNSVSFVLGLVLLCFFFF